MRSIYRIVLIVISALTFINQVNAANDSSKPVKVAVFIPLYADDVFTGIEFNSTKTNIPKNVLPGLEFYNGVMMAIDSLNNEGALVDISIYDTKSQSKSLLDQLKSSEMNDVGVIIAAITSTAELKTFSDQALLKNIPLISATYPNHVGIKENPFFVLLNSSFTAHVDGLYKYMKRNYSANEIIAVTRKGTTETFVKNYITSLNNSRSNAPLRIKWITLDETKLSFADFAASMDSTKNNVVFVASPLESFGLKVVSTLSSNSLYRTVAIGMPTWDNLKELDRPSCRNVEVVFSTPFLYYSQNKPLSSTINGRYQEKYYSRPSDMVFKGYETTYHFTKLLTKHRGNLVNNLSDKDFTVFNEFRLQPLKVSKTSIKPDLLENKKLYFIRKQQGNLKSIT